MSKIKWFGPVVAVVLLALAMGGPALGGKGGKGKPGGGGGDGGGTAAGTVYFRRDVNYEPELWRMDADGANKQMVLPFVPWPAEPSHDIHDGRRWFLAIADAAGTYPDGDPVRELLAVAGDGAVVTLLSSAEFEPFDSVRWTRSPGDTIISFVGLRWNLGTGNVADAGVFAVDIVFDPQTGSVVGVDAQSLAFVVPAVPIVDDDFDVRPDVVYHDWAPDSSAIAYSTWDDWLLIDDDLGTFVLTDEPARDPHWSPDGSRIAFKVAVPLGDIATVAPDGNDFKIILRSHHGKFRGVSQPRFSPTGGHLAYNTFGNAFDPVDVSRSTAEGGQKANLTSDTDDYSDPIAWR